MFDLIEVFHDNKSSWIKLFPVDIYINQFQNTNCSFISNLNKKKTMVIL